MNNLTVAGNALPPTSGRVLEKLMDAQSRLLPTNRFEIQTEHIFHGRLYARTIRLAAGTWIMGALMKIPTVLIVNGEARMLADDKWHALTGYNVIPARKRRKQIFVAVQDTEITMIFPTAARTVEAAEAEFTDEFEVLVSRRYPENDLITVTEDE